MSYYDKYLKYKNKYLLLKQQLEGGHFPPNDERKVYYTKINQSYNKLNYNEYQQYLLRTNQETTNGNSIFKTRVPFIYLDNEKITLDIIHQNINNYRKDFIKTNIHSYKNLSSNIVINDNIKLDYSPILLEYHTQLDNYQSNQVNDSKQFMNNEYYFGIDDDDKITTYLKNKYILCHKNTVIHIYNIYNTNYCQTNDCQPKYFFCVNINNIKDKIKIDLSKLTPLVFIISNHSLDKFDDLYSINSDSNSDSDIDSDSDSNIFDKKSYDYIVCEPISYDQDNINFTKKTIKSINDNKKKYYKDSHDLMYIDDYLNHILASNNIKNETVDIKENISKYIKKNDPFNSVDNKLIKWVVDKEGYICYKNNL